MENLKKIEKKILQMIDEINKDGVWTDSEIKKAKNLTDILINIKNYQKK